MPRYFFNTRIGDELIPDPEGEVLRDPDSAWEIARAMMIVTKKALDRRTVLRGLGTTVALPVLDAMVPALARAQAATKAPTRLSTIRLVWPGTRHPFRARHRGGSGSQCP